MEDLTLTERATIQAYLMKEIDELQDKIKTLNKIIDKLK